VQFVWNGVNDEANLRQFLAANVQWAELDVCLNRTRQRVILRHDPLPEMLADEDEAYLFLEDILETVQDAGKSVDLDLRENGPVLDRVVEMLRLYPFAPTRLWFTGALETLQEDGFRILAREYPGAILQCPIDFLVPLIVSLPAQAQTILETLRLWGVNRLALHWYTADLATMLDTLDAWGWEVTIDGVPDLEAFVKTVLLLPRAITSDFNFPAWHYYGRGAGKHGAYHRYTIKQLKSTVG
jgi:hypothetical protein